MSTKTFEESFNEAKQEYLANGGSIEDWGEYLPPQYADISEMRSSIPDMTCSFIYQTQWMNGDMDVWWSNASDQTGYIPHALARVEDRRAMSLADDVPNGINVFRVSNGSELEVLLKFMTWTEVAGYDETKEELEGLVHKKNLFITNLVIDPFDKHNLIEYSTVPSRRRRRRPAKFTTN